MKSIKDIVPFVFGIGAIVLGPVWTMTMFPEKLGDSYVFGVIDVLSVAFGILWLYEGYMNISKHRDEAGSYLNEKGKEGYPSASE